jgi:hypothetical protein
MSNLQDQISATHAHLSPSQLQEVQAIEEYLSANRVHEILNVRMGVCRRRWRS